MHAALPHRFGARVLAMCRALLKLSHAVSQHTAKPSAMSGNRRLCLFSPTMPREWYRRGCQAGVEIGGKRRRSDQRNKRLRAFAFRRDFGLGYNQVPWNGPYEDEAPFQSSKTKVAQSGLLFPAPA